MPWLQRATRRHRQAWQDYQHWQATDQATVKRLDRLIDDTLRDPLTGIGMPEPLKYGISGGMTRRITDQHRLVYLVRGDDLVLLQARYHYAR